MRLFDRIRRIANDHARYRRTLRELRFMPLDVALDLDLDRSSAPKIAREAVYGA